MMLYPGNINVKDKTGRKETKAVGSKISYSVQPKMDVTCAELSEMNCIQAGITQNLLSLCVYCFVTLWFFNVMCAELVGSSMPTLLVRDDKANLVMLILKKFVVLLGVYM